MDPRNTCSTKSRISLSLAWEESLEPLWKLIDDENWFYGLEYAADYWGRAHHFQIPNLCPGLRPGGKAE
jgi:hypothetical protein